MADRGGASALEGLALPVAEGVAVVTEVAVVARHVLRGAFVDVAAMLEDLLPQRINSARSDGARAALQLGPDEWVLLAFGGTAPGLPIAAAVAVVDISHRNIALEIAGPAVDEVLAAGCPLPLDLTGFPVDRATRTLLGKAEIVLWRRAADRFHIEVARSFAPYACAFLAAAIAGEAAIAALARRVGCAP